jgi:hypothetical protein
MFVTKETIMKYQKGFTTQEFSSQQTCITAGQAAKKLVSGTVKQIEYVCTPK